jgi:mono/diheme cytochrome c family protein
MKQMYPSVGKSSVVCRSVWIAVTLCALSSLAGAQTPAGKAAFNPGAFTEQYCQACHDDTSTVAGISFESVDWNNPGKSAPLLEKAIRKVGTGEMPPPGLPRPAAAEASAFTGWLVDSLDKYAAAHPNPGRPAIHRLNRAEYSNAIRDLLALDTKPGGLLPVDDSGYGFDNIGDVLSVSPSLIERYLSVANRVSRTAVGDLALKPSDQEFLNPMKSARDRVSDDLPFDSAGGMSVQYYFPLDAEYVIHVKMPGENGAVHELRLPIQAGLRTVGATFPKESFKAEVIPNGRRGPAAPAGGGAVGGGRGAPPPPPGQLDLRLDGSRVKVFDVASGTARQVDRIVISGPYKATGRGDTPSRERIFVCRPSSGAEEAPCARTILTKLARRAFRRSITDSDIKPLLAFYARGRAEGDFDTGIQKALSAMLVSPNFLFRVERDPKDSAPGSVYRLNDFALASRLSFFLWSTIPDDRLLDLAEQGKLKDPVVLQQQVQRMLDDPKSQALVDNFAGQWLYLRNLQLSRPDPDAFPEFDDNLRQAFRTETSLFFQNVLREDHSVLELLDANYTFLNQRLAEHYGIPNVYGPQFRKVILTDPNRGGLLGQGSVLTVTSYPNRTSVVQRGKWILETLLGTPPPPPPPVPELVTHSKDGRQLTMREQMEQHRANPVCASCHARMDPLGFALENYDGVGKWRDKDAGNPIDASGKLPDGATFVGPAGLKKILITKDRDQFISTATEKLLLYALGRGVEYYDEPAVRAISREAAKDDYRMSALIAAIVKSTPFEMRRTPDK